MPDDESIVGGIQIPSKSSKESIFSLGHTINFIENLIQCFEVNYHKIIIIYKIKMSELFKTIPKSLPPKKTDDYKENSIQLSGK